MSDSQSTQGILEALGTALALEEKGKKFFAEAAERVTGRLARQTFEFLIAEEGRHIERIKQFYAQVEASDGAEPPDVDEEDAERRLEAFNDRLAELTDELEPSLSDAEAYQFALKFETGAEEFYARMMQTSDNQHVRKFYRWLIREEAMHARLLNSCLKFAQDPSAWFQKRNK